MPENQDIFTVETSGEMSIPQTKRFSEKPLGLDSNFAKKITPQKAPSLQKFEKWGDHLRRV
jgi:hypothetical protein